MADFPTSPVNGDTHVIASSTWEYYAITDRWEILDTSGVPQSITTLITTRTPAAGDVTVATGPIVFSDYETIIITYNNIASDTPNSMFKMCKPHIVSGLDCINPRTYADGEGVMAMGGTQTITTQSGTSSSVITLNGTDVTTSHLNTIGPDYSVLTFGWTTGAFAAGGSIEVRGVAIQIAPNTLSHLDDVHTSIPSDGQILTWDNTNSYWKPSTSGGGGLGTGTQSWQTFVNEHPTSPMTPLRANNTNYQNTSGQPIFVSVTSYAQGSNNEGFLFVSPSSTQPSGSPTGGGNVRYDGPSTGWVLTGKGSGHGNEYDTDNATAIVPDQCWYRHTGAAPKVWTELR